MTCLRLSNRPSIIKAIQGASEAFTKAGIRHALIGGVAVGIFGYPRFNKDVDFLVGDEAFTVHPNGLVSFTPGVPISSEDIGIDSLTVRRAIYWERAYHPSGVREKFLVDALEKPLIIEGVPVVSVEALIYLKLKASRDQDMKDVAGMIEAGVDSVTTMDWLNQHSPSIAKTFRQIECKGKGNEDQGEGRETR